LTHKSRFNKPTLKIVTASSDNFKRKLMMTFAMQKRRQQNNPQ